MKARFSQIQLHIILQSCDNGDQEAGMLARCQHFMLSLKVLVLSLYNPQGNEKYGSRSLIHFAVFHNPIGNGGIQLFSLLQLKHLIQLAVATPRPIMPA